MSLSEAQQVEHAALMTAICRSLNKKNLPMVLKGGTALRLCYGLDRFSEDLDFDCAKSLNLETSLNEIFAHEGKTKPHLRNPQITVTKRTQTVKRYRVIYGDDIHLKIETSLRGTPKDNDMVEIDGILTYKISMLIKQKLSALIGRTAARDLHDVIYLYDQFPDDFGQDELAAITALYENQSAVLDEYNPAYDEDTILTVSDLLEDLTKLISLYRERHPE